MTPYLSYFHFFAATVYLLLAAYVLTRNPRSLLNRLCCALMLCFFCWSAGTTFVHNTTVPMATACLAEKIGSAGWLNFGGVFLCFVLVFVGHKSVIRYVVPVIAVIQSVLMFAQWNGWMLRDYRMESFGWIASWPGNGWEYLYQGYYLLVSLISLVLVWRVWRTEANAVRRKQAVIMVATGIVPLCLGSVSNVLLRQLGIYAFPPVADLFILVWASGMVYAISRYRLLSITPAAAADQIVATMADLCILLDVEGRIVSVNRAVTQLLGYDPEELRGRSTESILASDPQDGKKTGDIILGHTRKGLEIEMTARGGRRVPVNISCSGIPGVGYVCIGHDITEQKRARERLEQTKGELEIKVRERTAEIIVANDTARRQLDELIQTESRLRESEERLKTIFEYAPDAYYLSDLTGIFIDGNLQAEALTGYKREELIGKGFLDLKLLPVTQLPRAAVLLAKNMSGKRTGPDEFTLNRKDGDQVKVEISTIPLTIGGRSVVLGIARDITLRTQAQEEQSRLQEKLLQAQKMESIGQLAGGIAHDFNNIIGIITGYADLSRMESPPDSKIREYSDRILEVSMRAAELIAKVLAFARKGKHESVGLDVHQVVQDVTVILSHTLDKSIRITQDLSAQRCVISGDRAQIQNALMNLAVNARDAMPRGGTLSFSTATVKVDETYARDVKYRMIAGDYLKIVIGDTGTGMDESVRVRAFEPFFTTKQKGRGTGLGLASVYGTVKSHGGYVEIRSEPGTGTQMEILLPLTAAPAAVTGGEANALPEKGAGMILVVDDEPHMRAVTSEMLSGLGYTVVTCGDGTEAVPYYRTSGASVDLVVLDMIMPGMNGKDCFAELKKINPDVKALIVSGYAVDEEIDATLKMGAFGFLQKPFTIGQLSAAVGNAMQDA